MDEPMKFDREAFLQTPRTPTYDRRESMWLYVFHDDGRCKIGVSAAPEARLKQLKAGNARPIECAWSFFIPSRPAALAVERETHKLLTSHAMGREWFNIAPAAAIEVCEGVCGAVFDLIDRWSQKPPDADHVGPVADTRRKNIGYDEARQRAARRLGLA